jgi:hypothetical protein
VWATLQALGNVFEDTIYSFADDEVDSAIHAAGGSIAGPQGHAAMPLAASRFASACLAAIYTSLEVLEEQNAERRLAWRHAMLRDTHRASTRVHRSEAARTGFGQACKAPTLTQSRLAL